MEKNYVFGLSLALMFFASCADNLPLGDSGVEANKLPSVTLTEDEIVSIAYDNVEELSVENVTGIFKGFMKASAKKSSGTRAAIADVPIKVKSKRYIHQNADNVLEATSGPVVKTRSGETNVCEAPVYELEIENGSDKAFALVSGDPRAAKVLAFLPEADDETFNNVNTQIMLAVSKASLMEDIRRVEDVKSRLREQTLEKLGETWGVDPNEIVYEDVVKAIASESVQPSTRGYQGGEFVDESNVKYLEYFEDIQINSYVLPMGQIAWGQEKPYNRALPDEYIYVGGKPQLGKRTAGCGVIAMAEALAMVKPTNAYFDGIRMNWNLINAQERCIENPIIPGMTNKNTPVETLNMVGRLVKSIYNDSGTTPEYEIDPETGTKVNVSSSTDTSKMLNYLRTKIQCDDIRSWDPDVCKNSLDALNPVLVYGNVRVTYYKNEFGGTIETLAGHGYNIDGYFITEKLSRQLVQSNDVYWHVSLGWGPASRGYYKLGLDTKCNIICDNDGMKVRINVGETGKVTVNGQTLDLTQYMMANLRK